MKKITLLISAFALISVGAFSQNTNKKPHLATTASHNEKCGMSAHENFLRSQDPLYDIKKQIEMQKMALAIKNAPNDKGGVLTLPTVVHVVYNNAAENLTDANVINMINLLNADFRRTNTDAGNTPSAFLGVSADMDLEFCLATVDPSGNPTTGIIHQSTSSTSFSTNDNVKNTGAGGSSAWPTNQYFNIWICDLQGGLLGYGEFPTSPLSNTYGAVSDYCTVPGPSACAPYNLNRTMTHELSHCFNLYHIWGDDGGTCGGSDLIGDTPNQGDATTGCRTFPATDACTPTGNGVMFMNYMDYSNDNCMNMFTTGQKNRAHAAVQTYLSSVYNNTAACAPVVTSPDDAGVAVVNSPTGSICSGTINPVVDLRNYGTNALLTVTINYLVDGSPQTPFLWTGNLASATTTSVNLPSVAVSAGPHTFDANTTIPNGNADTGPTNDAATQTNFTNASVGVTLPYAEGFEGAYLPTGMTANNSDGLTTWDKTTVAAKSGSASIYMDYYNYSTSKGEPDDIITPAVDLSTGSNPQVTFELAYQLYTDPNDPTPYSDTLEVLISTDCGLTWNSLYRKEDVTLVTATPVFSTVSFVPTANQWRQETISLAAYASATSAMVMFRGIGDYENQMYIDDINIDFSTGIEDNVVNNSVNIFPNPATDIINVLFTSTNNSEIVVFNLVGEVIYTNKNVLNRINKVDMSKQANGVYFVKVKSGDQITTKKIILVK